MFELTNPDLPPHFQGTVPGNLWTQIPAPQLDIFKPGLKVAVIIPFYQQERELDRTLAGLAHQDYPPELLEVVIADDGSDPPYRAPSDPNKLSIRVVRQERDGFGLARARNLGAHSTDAEIIVFLDADMVPEPHFVAAHARWHHVVPDGIVFGFRKHVETDDIDPTKITAALDTSSLQELFSDRAVTVPEWIEGHIKRTDNVTSKRDDLYRAASGGNLSIRRDFYLTVGGNDETFQEYGGEDNEFTYRALLEGGVLIPERAALAWHQGAGTWQRSEETLRRELTRVNLQQRISEQSMRHSRPGRTYLRPHIGVIINVANEPVNQLVLVVEAILGSWFHDVHIEVRGTGARPDDLVLTREFEHDQRVSIVDDGAASVATDAAILVTVPTTAILGRRTLDLIEAELRHGGPGAMHITIPHLNPSEGMVEIVQRRALRRAQRHQGSFASLPDAVAQLFGERWVSGADLGIERYEAGMTLGAWVPPDERPQIVRPTMEINDLMVQRLAKRIQRVEINLARMRARKIVRLTNLAGAVLRMKGIRLAARQVRSADSEVRELAAIEAELRSLIRPT